ncbi:MAG: hypothetical protein DHS20C18_41790 [Saprospiraceae bacterium]|nr:MAG: hypothetical protein DHS20C18_41790 [Saprospiraceae bacterium]
MEFWNKKVNVSKEAAARQVAIINKFPSGKRLKIATDFANMGINRTREWIKETNPNMSELELNLEFVRLMYRKDGSMDDKTWEFFKSKMEEKIKKNWGERFRNMMKENSWTYDDIAKMGNFKSGKVIEATISRGLPAFAKLAVKVYELSK